MSGLCLRYDQPRRGCSSTARTSAFQADDASSILVARSIHKRQGEENSKQTSFASILNGAVIMTRYRRIRLGVRGSELERCLKENFAGLDYSLPLDLTGNFQSTWREFNEVYIPIWLENHPGKGKVAAGLSCGALWTFCYEMQKGDYILSPDENVNFHIGQIDGDYFYQEGEVIPHRRPIKWLEKTFDRSLFSEEFLRSVRGPLSNVDVDKFSDEIERVIGGEKPLAISSNRPEIEDPIVFALESHLEEFLVTNWENTELGNRYDLWKEEGVVVGQQYPTDTGPIDLFAVSKDGNELLVIELKKGKVSDSVVGQIQRYMGFVTSELAESHQKVRGIIIALEDDLRLQRSLSVTQNIDFYKYTVDFKLDKAN